MEVVTSVLGGVVIALISGIVGQALESKDSIKKTTCDERQRSCQQLIIEKIDNVADKVEMLTKVVNSKLLNI